MQKLLELNDAASIEGGLFPALAPNQAALWRTGSNVYFKDGKVQKFPGFARTLFPDKVSPGPIVAMAQAFVNGTRRVYFCTFTKVYKWSPGEVDFTEIASGSGFSSLAPFGTSLLIGSSLGAPWLWPNAGMATQISPYPGNKSTIILIFQNHAVASDGQTVLWSNKSDFATWTPTPENSAGSLFIRDLDSDIAAIQPLGNALGVYSADSLSIMSYLGAPLYFGVVPAINGVGALNSKSIISVGRKNYGISKKGFFVTDGIEFNYIDGPAVNDWYKPRSRQTVPSQYVGLHFESIEHVCWWFQPINTGLYGECVGLAFNYKNSSWTIMKPVGIVTAAIEQQVLDYPFLAVDLTGSSDQHTIGGLDSLNYGWEAADNDGSFVPFPSDLETFQLDAGERERFKRWDMLRVEVETPLAIVSGLEVRFGFSDQPGEDPEWTDWAQLGYENWIHRESVYITVGLRSLTGGTSYKIGGAAVHGEMGGYL